MEQSKKSYHIVLVHGACHGAWCWYKLSTLLTSQGHQVTALDLAASGIDSTRVEDLKSFDEYSKPLYDIMDSIPNGEKIVLVGHSLGGVSIAKAMQMFHHKIHVAVFVAASLPQISYSLKHHFLQFNKQEPLMNDVMDKEGHFHGDNEARGATSFLFGPKYLASKLYQLCPPEDLMLARTLVRPCPIHLLEGENTLFLTKEGYGSVWTVYVVCCKDNVISEKYQRLMIGNHGVEQVFEIEADHMAMLSKPQELCQAILKVTGTINSTSS